MRGTSAKQIALLVFLCAAGASHALAQQPAVSNASATSDALSPGDRLEIDVIRVPELSGEFEILPDGTLEQPLYRGVTFTGISEDSVNALVRGVVARFQTHPQFVVKPRYRITITGEVRHPNIYALSPQTTVAEAVAVAGGVTDAGDLKHVVLTRRLVILKVNLSKPGGVNSATTIRSGDTISIPTASRRNDSFLQVIAFAIGLAGAAAIIGSH